MKNRPINPKAEGRLAKPAADDLQAMVTDRRSGRGKEGAPAHLPTPPIAADHVSEDEAALLRHQVDEQRAAHETADRSETAARRDRAIADGTTIALEGAMRHLRKKYALADGDSVNPGTGKITRAPI
jgi:hypothetical protein